MCTFFCPLGWRKDIHTRACLFTVSTSNYTVPLLIICSILSPHIGWLLFFTSNFSPFCIATVDTLYPKELAMTVKLTMFSDASTLSGEDSSSGTHKEGPKLPPSVFSIDGPALRTALERGAALPLVLHSGDAGGEEGRGRSRSGDPQRAPDVGAWRRPCGRCALATRLRSA